MSLLGYLLEATPHTLSPQATLQAPGWESLKLSRVPQLAEGWPPPGGAHSLNASEARALQRILRLVDTSSTESCREIEEDFLSDPLDSPKNVKLALYVRLTICVALGIKHASSEQEYCADL